MINEIDFIKICELSDITLIGHIISSFTINIDIYYKGLHSILNHMYYDRVDLIKFLIDKAPHDFNIIESNIFNIACMMSRIDTVKMLISNKYVTKDMVWSSWAIVDFQQFKKKHHPYYIIGIIAYEYLLDSVFTRSLEKKTALKINLIDDCKWIIASYL